MEPDLDNASVEKMENARRIALLSGDWFDSHLSRLPEKIFENIHRLG
jgi:hypothetical protein